MRWRICSTRLILPCGWCAMPKQPITSQRDLPCSRPSRLRPSARSKSSRCNVPWGFADGRKGLCGPGSGTCLCAHKLCQQVGDTPQLCFALWGLLQFHIVRAEIQTALELGERLISLAQSIHDLDILMAAHNGLGTALPYRGALCAARAHLEQSIALYDPHKHHARAFFYGTNLKADSLAHLAHVLWLLGYPEQALQRGSAALTLAQAQEPLHSFTLAHVSNLIAVVHHLRREERLAQERAEVARRLSSEHGFAGELGRGTILQGWALVVQGNGEGLMQMRQGLAAYQATGAELWRPYYLALLAEAYDKGGQLAEGLRLLSEALALIDNSGEGWWEAELHRLRGEFVLGQEDARHKAVEAEECFQRALAVAQQQQAVPGATGCHEPESSLAGARQTRSGPADVSGDLRLVHRGF